MATLGIISTTYDIEHVLYVVNGTFLCRGRELVFWCLMTGVMSSDISSCYKVGSGQNVHIYTELLLG